MPLFLLVRHGENDFISQNRLAGRLPGVHLNRKGIEQAESVAKYLKEAPVKAIYSSPLERALETAAPIGQALSLPVQIREGLIEVDVGEWQGKKLGGLRRLKLWKVVQTRPSRLRFPGGESFIEAQKRICDQLDHLASQHESKEIIVCISHADPIRLAVAFHVGLPLDFFQRLFVAPASITALDVQEAESRLIALNYEIPFTLPKT